MSRYIDAEQIVYTWLIDNDGKEHDGVTLQSVIDMMPTADVVEVIRCKDCRWYERDIFDREAGVCFNPNKCTKTLGFGVQNEDYCSYGERADA